MVSLDKDFCFFAMLKLFLDASESFSRTCRDCNQLCIFNGFINFSLKGDLETPQIIPFGDQDTFKLSIYGDQELCFYFPDIECGYHIVEVKDQFCRFTADNKPPTLLLEFEHFNALIYPTQDYNTWKDAEVCLKRALQAMKEVSKIQKLQPISKDTITIEDYEKRWTEAIALAGQLQQSHPSIETVEKLVQTCAFLQQHELEQPPTQDCESIKNLLEEQLVNGKYISDRLKLFENSLIELEHQQLLFKMLKK
jgi:hypothetical protein